MPEVSPTKYVVMATWDDVPHLDEAAKKALWDSIPPYQRDARSKGIPQLGAGAIYPIQESELLVDPFELPIWWPRVYGMDVGWNRTAALWGAINQETDTLYLYDEYYRGQAEPAVHVASIKIRGSWIPGVIDPASKTPSQRDGERLFIEYRDMGLDLFPASRGSGPSPREGGILAVWKRMTTGRVKVFRSLVNFWGEFRVYRRAEDGTVVKQNDHLMDCLRYLVTTGIHVAALPPDDDERMAEFIEQTRVKNTGRSSIGGY
jgi:hypothetical protein